jgi:hypothetical protein
MKTFKKTRKYFFLLTIAMFEANNLNKRSFSTFDKF